MQAGVLRRMTGPDHHLPVVVADGQEVAILQPVVAHGQGIRGVFHRGSAHCF